MAKDDEKAKKRMENERQLTINMMIYVGKESLMLFFMIFFEMKFYFLSNRFEAGFGISWTPYALVALISAFIDPNLVTPMGSLLPALFAKTSMVWSTIFYIMSNKQIKYKVFKPPADEKTADSASKIR